MKTTLFRRRRAARGQGAVELALIAMVLMTLLVGVIEFSRIAAVYVSVLNGAREGARAGAIPNATNTTIQNAVNATVLAFGNTVTTTVCPNTVAGSATCAPVSGSITRSSGGTLVVTVSCPFTFFPPISAVVPSGFTLTSTAVAQIG